MFVFHDAQICPHIVYQLCQWSTNVVTVDTGPSFVTRRLGQQSFERFVHIITPSFKGCNLYAQRWSCSHLTSLKIGYLIVWILNQQGQAWIVQIGNRLYGSRTRIPRRTDQECNGSMAFGSKVRQQSQQDAHSQIFETKGWSMKQFGNVQIGSNLCHGDRLFRIFKPRKGRETNVLQVDVGNFVGRNELSQDPVRQVRIGQVRPCGQQSRFERCERWKVFGHIQTTVGSVSGANRCLKRHRSCVCSTTGRTVPHRLTVPVLSDASFAGPAGSPPVTD